MRAFHKVKFGLFVIGTLMLAPSVTAQTVANGPYYATPSWDQTLPVTTRFIVLANMNQEAVLDRETGLVWERSPDATPDLFFNALFTCWNKNVGGRKGWRMPAVPEIMSLVDANIPFPGPVLPPGHPFLNVQSLGYWASWSRPDAPTRIAVLMTLGSSTPINSEDTQRPVWCVRGAPTSGFQ
jgi:Protein of unknown function (DUF1566)